MPVEVLVALGIWLALVAVAGTLAQRDRAPTLNIWDGAVRRAGFEPHAGTSGGVLASEFAFLHATGFGRELRVSRSPTADTLIHIDLHGPWGDIASVDLLKLLDAVHYPSLPRHMDVVAKCDIGEGTLTIEVFGELWRDVEVTEQLDATRQLAQYLDGAAFRDAVLDLAQADGPRMVRRAAVRTITASRLPVASLRPALTSAMRCDDGHTVLLAARAAYRADTDIVDDPARARIADALPHVLDDPSLVTEVIRALCNDERLNPDLHIELIATLRRLATATSDPSVRREARRAADGLRASLDPRAAGNLSMVAPAPDAGGLSLSAPAAQDGAGALSHRAALHGLHEGADGDHLGEVDHVEAVEVAAVGHEPS